jgi:hypothetical protein
MPYFIHKNVPNIITVKFDGEVNLEERKKAVDEVCDLVNLDEPVNLLIDVRTIIMKMSKDEQIYFGKYLASKNELAKAKVAVVHVPANNPNQLINTVAYMEGYQVVDFDSEYYANEWLNGKIK